MISVHRERSDRVGTNGASYVADLPDASRQKRLSAYERKDWICVQVVGLDADIKEKENEIEKLRVERSRYASPAKT